MIVDFFYLSVVTELPETDGLELDYFEYKLNEILDTQTTYIESTLLPPLATNTTTNGEEKLYLEEKENFFGQQLKSDFKVMSGQILKYCSYCLEQPKLLYSIVYKVLSSSYRFFFF
jgi:hypothetical protein